MIETVRFSDRCATEVLFKSIGKEANVSSATTVGPTSDDNLVCAWIEAKSPDDRPLTVSIVTVNVNLPPAIKVPFIGCHVDSDPGVFAPDEEEADGVHLKSTLHDPIASKVYWQNIGTMTVYDN